VKIHHSYKLSSVTIHTTKKTKKQKTKKNKKNTGTQTFWFQPDVVISVAKSKHF